MNHEPGFLQGYRWTLVEYVLRCKLGRDVKDILVEGALDHDVLIVMTRHWEADVSVFESDFFEVTHEEVDSAGVNRGAKGKLLTIAAALEADRDGDSLKQRTAVVVDRDYDAALGESSFVFETDGCSMESYAFNSLAFDSFVTKVLGRFRRPAGAHGFSQQRNVCTGTELMERVQDGIAGMASVRLSLSEAKPPLRPFSRWIDHAKVSGDGFIQLNASQLLEDVLTTKGQVRMKKLLIERQEHHLAEVKSDLVRWARGHDLVDLLSKVLQSPWGKKRNGHVAASSSRDDLARLLLFSVDFDDLRRQPLFAALEQRFA